ncbi:DNA-binding transcriptional MerR regulator [Saccharothrix tamanrassetensis]|uniref:DNA-binding transcriptional MerR regulator n=1 Tax=Saccharothrix tamanrassetensis TaxID=1051531 RepID=A0A841CB46_9PSEU|nr:MerR family transcriptional regulator [Saccharothrix tamanrassetensis]MBB5954431.1 DNA-binding transcriptional MerR regulator [Saccharothrix tamanrassetensis]
MTHYSIGQLARLTGLSTRTIRFYSDSGLIPVAGRTVGGFRTYDVDGLARLKLVRTLRDLGVDLPTAQRVLAREVSVAEVARTHAEAIDAQLRTLRLRRAVLRVVARNGEVEMVHEMARLSEDERQAILDDFFDEVFGGLDLDPDFRDRMRSVRVELPDDPTPEQLEAWIELANLVRDQDFRASIRQMSVRHQEMRAEGADLSGGGAEQMEAFQHAMGAARAALDAGIAPTSDEGRRIVAEVNERWSRVVGVPVGPELTRQLEQFGDPRAERYWMLLATINGWPPVPDTSAERKWLAEAGRQARTRQSR